MRILPRIINRCCHISPRFLFWLQNFPFPRVDISKPDCLLWGDFPVKKLKTWHIWSSIRNRNDSVPWSCSLWNKLQVLRFSHHNWIVCRGMLSTKMRLASFGIQVDTACTLCVGGLESQTHLFTRCTYSSYILRNLLSLLQIQFMAATWTELLQQLYVIPILGRRLLDFLTVNIFTYHIWRERNRRDHDRGCFRPLKLQNDILLDIKTRLSSSPWFLKLCINDLFLASWLL